MEAFQHRQRQLTDYLRDPESTPPPSGIEARRLRIYSELFFNNFEGFLSHGFPVCRSVFTDTEWLNLVRAFMRDHRCHSPYFLDIAEAFLGYLEARQDDSDLPGFLYELAHYEWVELALDIAEGSLPAKNADKAGIVDSDTVLALSPVAWSLAYRYPVHRIGPENLPDAPGEGPTFIVVYRNRQERVQFLEVNALTAQLLALLDVVEGRCVGVALAQLAKVAGMELQTLEGFALQLLQQLTELDIVIIPAQNESQ